jgi:hypothetical protein
MNARLIFLAAFIGLTACQSQAQGRCAILLHGLARTETSFALMEAALETEGNRGTCRRIDTPDLARCCCGLWHAQG